MVILKKHRKILNYVRRKGPVMLITLHKKFDCSIVGSLLLFHYLICINDHRELDPERYIVGDLPDSSLISLSDIGLAEVESYDWFDLKYVLTMIIIPLLIGIGSGVFTNVILFWLLTSR